MIIISGPGGVGKGTIVRELFGRDPRLWLSRSWTTRQPRPGESPDAYRFATDDQFQEHIDAGGFLEWVQFLDYKQGTPVPDLPPGRDAVFEIDVHGARQILEQHPEALSVFIAAPSPAEQEARLRARGEREERIAQRLAKADEESTIADSLGSVRIVNDVLADAVDEILALIDSRRP